MYIKDDQKDVELEVLYLLYKIKYAQLSKHERSTLGGYTKQGKEKVYTTEDLFTIISGNHFRSLSVPYFKKVICTLLANELIEAGQELRKTALENESTTRWAYDTENHGFTFDFEVSLTQSGETMIQSKHIITSITIVKTENQDYLIVINEKYDTAPIKVRKRIKKWEHLYELATLPKAGIPFDKDTYDYMNYGTKGNPLYTRTGYAKSRIITQQGDRMMAGISIKIISHTVYLKRKNST